MKSVKLTGTFSIKKRRKCKIVESDQIWETDLQKSIDFLLNPFFVFQNDLYVNLLHYMYTCCYTKMK